MGQFFADTAVHRFWNIHPTECTAGGCSAFVLVGDRKRDILVFRRGGISVRWSQLTVANCSCPNPSSPTPGGLRGPNGSRQNQRSARLQLVSGSEGDETEGREVQEGEGPRDKEREKLAGRFWKAVTFPMMSAFPITALTPDPGR